MEYRGHAPPLPSSEAERTAALAEVQGELRPASEWASDSSARPVLDGLKVLDFTWLAAGPLSTRVLADFGATVVKVENNRRLDAMRILPPNIHGRTDPDSGGGFHSACAGKLSLNLDMKHDGARDVAIDLVRWADVVVESFSPRAMPAWGLDFDTLQDVKPDLIMVSSSLFGQDGPYAMMGGVGFMGAALGGFTRLTGWPDRDPTGPWGPYTDYVAPRATIAALLAALDHRRRTGQGQWVDVSQIEASLGFLGPQLVDFALNGTMPEALGNRHPSMAPHGVYAAEGEDSWVAIACRDDHDWTRLCRAIDRDALAADSHLASFVGRKDQEDRVDQIVAKWAASVTSAEAERCLTAAGVPAAAVIDHRTLSTEHQFSHRKHIARVDHPLHEHTYIESTHIGLSRTPGQAGVAGPLLGEHTGLVLRELLGYDERRVRDLVRDGVVATSTLVPDGEECSS
ncbi:CaiB/BaiF CoA transferase family protein [Candidatus Poriferisocius sp.]|uniref:CaiB/BaiF CoA transferase family protein n=1 Tax=Candidatus Poriferisocius sp. TaxID=3101276 RepID=UPI003B0171FE